MSNLFKIYGFLISYFWLASFLFPLWIFAEHTTSAEKVIEEKERSTHLNIKLYEFLNFVNDLQNQGLLNGEVLVARNDQILLNLQSEV